MLKSIRDIFTKAAITGAMFAPFITFAQQSDPLPHSPTTSVPASSTNMSVRDASLILQRANRATDALAIAGIISSITSSGKAKTEAGTIDVGISKESCEVIRKQKSFMVDTNTYLAAQKTLVDAGHLTAERAARDYETQVNFLKIMKQTTPVVTKACADFDKIEINLK